MQGLPLLSEIYPDHWLFEDHPHAFDMADPTSDSKLHRFIRLQRAVYASAVSCEDGHLASGMHGPVPWEPSRNHIREAKIIGATWLTDHKVSEKQLDPVAARARDRNRGHVIMDSVVRSDMPNAAHF